MRTESPEFLASYHQAVMEYESTLYFAGWHDPVLSSRELRAAKNAATRRYWRTMRMLGEKYPITKEGPR